MRSRNWRVRGSDGALKIASGAALLEDHACVQEADAVRDVAGKAHLVRRDQHRHPALGELADHAQDLRHELGVERARHLVEQHHARTQRERAHDRDSLLLPARKPVGVVVALVGEPEAVEQLGRLRLGLPPARTECLARPERHVLEHAHVREEVVGLEDDPDPAADPVHVDAACRDLLAVDHDAARVDRLEQVDAAQQGRLARAGCADQADDLVLRDLEVDPAQHLVLAERLVQLLDHDRAHAMPPATRRRRSRATSQSVKRASGIVIATKSVAATR